MMATCCPEVPNCCDMRGMLSFLILWSLSKKPMNGQQLSEAIGNRRGVKPTAGTIYPALKELRLKKLVKMERKGRETVYSLSEKGRKGLKEACEYFCYVFGEIFQEYGEKTRCAR